MQQSSFKKNLNADRKSLQQLESLQRLNFVSSMLFFVTGNGVSVKLHFSICSKLNSKPYNISKSLDAVQ